jgi:hypothetical protein
MVGDELRQGGGVAELTAEVRAGYDAAAEEWADGAEPLVVSMVVLTAS